VSANLSVITIGIDPTIEVGPVTIAWHGLTIAIGILIGGIAVAHESRRRGLEPDRIYAIAMILILGALVGGRAFYLLEHGQLDDPGAWLGTTGFTFYGGFIAAALGIAYYVRHQRLSVNYLDAIAAGLPLPSRSAASATSSTASALRPAEQLLPRRAQQPSRGADPEPTPRLPLRRPLRGPDRRDRLAVAQAAGALAVGADVAYAGAARPRPLLRVLPAL